MGPALLRVGRKEAAGRIEVENAAPWNGAAED